MAPMAAGYNPAAGQEAMARSQMKAQGRRQLAALPEVKQPLVRGPGKLAPLGGAAGGGSELQEEERSRMRAAFAEYDRDGSGEIDQAELDALLRSLDLGMEEAVLQDYLKVTLKDLDRDLSGGISAEEFERFYRNVLLSQPPAWRKMRGAAAATPTPSPPAGKPKGGPGGLAAPPLHVGDIQASEMLLREAFESVDVDCSGFLSPEEMVLLFKDLGYPDTDGDGYERFVTEEFAKADADGDGGISFQEFAKYANDFIEYASSGATLLD